MSRSRHGIWDAMRDSRVPKSNVHRQQQLNEGTGSRQQQLEPQAKQMPRAKSQARCRMPDAGCRMPSLESMSMSMGITITMRVANSAIALPPPPPPQYLMP
jgi:hypothetical protein